ncbi:hypothetical protein TEA_014036 [Camellia sinensis var. sinensis]|uniref:MIF4G domain-containing protein n=1 Tax=Camellia sinensis var. sinensis TaxID=542762 RepID=A0A4S4EJM8_CAMSN|nr:hypothetical protein TEA_014036 [Camellia sinensis var. sinensis]
MPRKYRDESSDEDDDNDGHRYSHNKKIPDPTVVEIGRNRMEALMMRMRMMMMMMAGSIEEEDVNLEREKGSRDRDRKDRYEHGSDDDDDDDDDGRERGRRDREREDEKGSDEDGKVVKARGKPHRERNNRHEIDSSGDDGRRVERETGKRDRNRLMIGMKMGIGGKTGIQRETMKGRGGRGLNFKMVMVVMKRGIRKREAEEVHTSKDGWRSRRDMQDADDSRDGRNKRSARQRDGEVGDDYEKDGRRSVNIARRKLEWRLGQFREKWRGVHTAFQAGPDDERENLIRGRGLFCRLCMKSQMASPGFTDVFTALVAVVNTKFPEVGDLLWRRIILQLKRAYKRNYKPQLLAAVKFIAHLVDQQVFHELVALELLTLLLDKPTDDSVEVAVGFVTGCGSIRQDLCPRGLHGEFSRTVSPPLVLDVKNSLWFKIMGFFVLHYNAVLSC